MDLVNIFSVTTLLVLLYISDIRSATVTLSKSAEKGKLGNNSLSLFCNYSLSAGDILFRVTLKRKRADDPDFHSVVSYYEDDKLNATYYMNGSDLVGRTVLTNPTSANRRATLQFSSIQCTDEADYRCELSFAKSGQGDLKTNSDTKIVVTATPMFENQSLLYTPLNNLEENQNVTFTCSGNVGREPQGTFSWYKYVGGQGMVITEGIKPVSLTNVGGSCTYVRTENLILTLKKEDNQMVIRCTVRQTTMTETGDGNIQTDHITVYYVPRINSIGSNPDSPIYSEGLAQLLLTCSADSNPPSDYVWTLPDGTVQTGNQLRLTNLTTNHTGRYTCMAYTGWGGQNYTANNSSYITVVATTKPPPTTTTTTRSSTTVSTKKTGTAADSGNTGAQAGLKMNGNTPDKVILRARTVSEIPFAISRTNRCGPYLGTFTSMQILDFQVLILDEAVLALARMYRRDVLVLDDEVDLMSANSHAAYRQFVLWQHGRLGSEWVLDRDVSFPLAVSGRYVTNIQLLLDNTVFIPSRLA